MTAAEHAAEADALLQSVLRSEWLTSEQFNQAKLLGALTHAVLAVAAALGDES